MHQLYASIEKAKELGLIKTWVGRGKYPPRNIIEITGKGKKIAMKMREILQLLGK